MSTFVNGAAATRAPVSTRRPRPAMGRLAHSSPPPDLTADSSSVLLTLRPDMRRFVQQIHGTGLGGDPEIEAILERIRALGGVDDPTSVSADLGAIRADLRRLENDRRAVVENLR